MSQINAAEELAQAVRSSYSSPRRHVGPVPDYAGIRAGSVVLNVVGTLSIVAGFVASVVGVRLMVVARTAGASWDAVWVGGGSMLLLGLGLAGYGVLGFMWASVGMAIRDMARNSFRN